MHGFLPDTMMVTIIALIIKNKSGDLSDNNYRPIVLSTVASKLFESLILSRATRFLIIFEMLIFFVKNTFSKLYCKWLSMYVYMLDASKAFGKVAVQ